MDKKEMIKNIRWAENYIEDIYAGRLEVEFLFQPLAILEQVKNALEEEKDEEG